MSEIFTAAFWAEYGGILAEGLLDTLVMVVASTFFAYLIGLPMGVLSVLTQPHGICPKRTVNAVLGWVINIGRSFPFAILMVALKVCKTWCGLTLTNKDFPVLLSIISLKKNLDCPTK